MTPSFSPSASMSKTSLTPRIFSLIRVSGCLLLPRLLIGYSSNTLIILWQQFAAATVHQIVQETWRLNLHLHGYGLSPAVPLPLDPR